MPALTHNRSSALGSDTGAVPVSQTWRPLGYFNLYRFLLAGLMLGLHLAGIAPGSPSPSDPSLFFTVSVLYLGFSTLAWLATRWRTPSYKAQVYIQLLVDITAVTLLMHASGGVQSGLGILLVITVAAGSILIAGRMALGLAAAAALAVLGEQSYMYLTGLAAREEGFTQAGMLGTAFFATAILVHILAQRLRESEALAVQRGIDLANLAQLNETIIQRMQSGILVVDENNRVRLMNESAWHLLGMPAVGQGAPLGRVSQVLDQQLKVWRERPAREPHAFRPEHGGAEVLPRFARLGREGEEPTASVIFLEDSAMVTQRAQQMKLASLGRLTASIAHEIRNPLGAISHAAQLLAESPVLDHGDRRLTEIIREQSQRVNNIVENVLQLSRREPARPKTFRLKPWLEAFVEEFRHSNDLEPEQIQLDVQPEDTEIHMDPGQLRQVLWNLCHNSLKHGSVDDRPARIELRGGAAGESRGPFLDVMDSGPGIDPDMALQIFEPFFTTDSKGTGLGLYIAKELCECNRAELSYLPSPRGGNCFRIVFPDPNRQTL